VQTPHVCADLDRHSSESILVTGPHFFVTLQSVIARLRTWWTGWKVRRPWPWRRPSFLRRRGVSALGITLLPPLEEEQLQAQLRAPSTELALDLEVLLLAHDPAEARTTAVAPEALAELSSRRR
jgi:hypothetical protein